MRRAERRSLMAAGLVLAVAAAAWAVAAAGRAPVRSGAPPGRPATTAVPDRLPTAATGGPPTSTTPATVASTTTTTLPAPATTAVPATQTTALPSATTPRFRAEMSALFQAVRLGSPARATAAFFPEAPYVRLKAIADPAADYTGRLLAEYRLDVEAAHAYLGPAARGATFAGVEVPEQEAAWIPPGYCWNRIGYWHDPGARLLYRSGGVLRSIGIASLISWHGVWYVVHLGGVVRSSEVGLVDDPATGPGVPGPPGGC